MIRRLLIAVSALAIASPVCAQPSNPIAMIGFGSIIPVTGTGTSLIGKAAPGNLFGYTFTEGATAGYFAILNVAAVPAASAVIAPIECIPVAANTVYRAPNMDIADRYTVGIAVVSTTNCTTNVAVTPQVMKLGVQ